MFLLLFFIPIRANALLLFTRDWGSIPELGSGWSPQTAEVFEKPTSLKVVVSDSGSDSTQVGCMESSDADEITAWLQGSHVFFSRDDLRHVAKLLNRNRSMVFCYGVKTFEVSFVETLQLESPECFDSLPPEIIVAERRQNLTVLAWEVFPVADAVWVISTLPLKTLDSGLRRISQDFRIPEVLGLLSEFTEDRAGDRTCWLESVPRTVLQSGAKWVNLPPPRGTIPPSI